jgi:hypothetical protein
MPVTLDLSVSELAETRFAVSPLSETISGLQQLAHGRPWEGNRRWMHWATDDLAARPLELARTWPLIVNDRSSWPQFLLPAPVGAETTIDDDLAAMQRTTARQARASLTRVFGDDLPVSAVELAAHPAAGLRAIAAELREAHDRLIAPHWARVRAVLDADIAYRARQLATGGAERLFADLHPDLHWHDGRLTIDNDHRDRAITTGPGGLVLLPVVLGPRHLLGTRRTGPGDPSAMICHCARTTLGLSTATGATRSRLTSTSSSKRGRGPSTRHMPLRRL